MKKLITLFICAILFIIGCNKFDDDFVDDLQGDATISGKLNYRDNISGSGELKLMAGRKVFIGKDTTDYNNYLYYSVTDAQGNFTFKRLKKGGTYLLFVNDTINGIYYSTYITKSAPTDSMTLLAENDTLRQNGMLLYVLNSEQQPLKGAKVWLYNNKEVFESDTVDNANSIKDSATDQYGRVIFYNYKAGNYYLRAKFNSPAGIISADTAFTFSGKGISKNTILLSTSLTIKNTLVLTVVDESGAILPGINCCIFNNPLLFNQEDCEGKYLERSSGADGMIKLTNLQAGNYYLYATFTQGNTHYKGKATIFVNATGKTSVNLILKKETAPTELLLTAIDNAGTPVNGTHIYFFTSRSLWALDNTAGSVRDVTTDANGSVTVLNMPEGKYYLRARVKLDDQIVMKGADSVNIPAAPAKVSQTILVQ